MRLYLTLFSLILIPQLTFAHKVKPPKDVQTAVLYLKEHFTDTALNRMMMMTDDSMLLNLYIERISSFKLMSGWFMPGRRSSRIKKYMVSKGVTIMKYQVSIVLIGYKRALMNEPFNEDEIFQHFANIEKKLQAEQMERYCADSIQGVYIPKDLQDCFRQLDSMWADSIKMKVKAWSEDEFRRKTHFTTGLWMRNNWQFWGGSRLSKYFNELGIYHPDDMSGIILCSYHRYLNGKEIKLEEQIKYYKAYWKASKKKKRSKDYKTFNIE